MTYENILVVIVLAAAAITDVKKREIPNWLLMAGIIASLIISAFRGWNVLAIRIIVAAILFLIMYFLLFRTGLLPGGDIKALTFTVLALGPLMFVDWIGYLAVCSIPCIIYYGIIRTGKTIPYALPMFLASVILVWRGVF